MMSYAPPVSSSVIVSLIERTSNFKSEFQSKRNARDVSLARVVSPFHLPPCQGVGLPDFNISSKFSLENKVLKLIFS